MLKTFYSIYYCPYKTFIQQILLTIHEIFSVIYSPTAIRQHCSNSGSRVFWNLDRVANDSFQIPFLSLSQVSILQSRVLAPQRNVCDWLEPYKQSFRQMETTGSMHLSLRTVLSPTNTSQTIIDDQNKGLVTTNAYLGLILSCFS